MVEAMSLQGQVEVRCEQEWGEGPHRGTSSAQGKAWRGESAREAGRGAAPRAVWLQRRCQMRKCLQVPLEVEAGPGPPGLKSILLSSCKPLYLLLAFVQMSPQFLLILPILLNLVLFPLYLLPSGVLLIIHCLSPSTPPPPHEQKFLKARNPCFVQC